MSSSASTAKRAVRAEIEKMAALVHQNEHTYITTPTELDRDGKPTGFKFSLLTTGGARNIQINEAINDYKKDVLQPLMMSFLMIGMDRTGAMSLHSSATDLFAVALGAIMDGIQDVLNRFLVADLFKLNGVAPELWPRIEHGDIEKRNLSEFADLLLRATDAGIVTPDASLEDFFRNEAGLPPVDDAFRRDESEGVNVQSDDVQDQE